MADDACADCPPLGCPDGYSVRITEPCGSTVVAASALDPFVRKVEWKRRLNDVSTAAVTIDAAAGPGCCPPTEDAEPGMHELVIERDGCLVWSGPLETATVESGSGMTVFEANDPLGYLGSIVNTTAVGMAGDVGKDVSYVAWDMIRGELTGPFTCTPDCFCLLDSAVIEACGTTWKLPRRELWTAYLLDILHKLAELNFEFFAIGHTLVIRPARGKDAPARARLSPEHVGGAVTFVRSRSDLATRTFATNSTGDGNSTGEGQQRPAITVTEGQTCTPYCRIDTLVTDTTNTSQDTPDAVIAAHLHDLALNALRGRYPAPVSVRVQDGAHLSPDAPVCINDLIPGERFDVFATEGCGPIQAAMRLVGIDVTWDGGIETVGVSLTPLATLELDTYAPAKGGKR